MHGHQAQNAAPTVQSYSVKWSSPKTGGAGFVPGGPFTHEYALQLAAQSNKQFKPLKYEVVPAS